MHIEDLEAVTVLTIARHRLIEKHAELSKINRQSSVRLKDSRSTVEFHRGEICAKIHIAISEIIGAEIVNLENQLEQFGVELNVDFATASAAIELEEDS